MKRIGVKRLIAIVVVLCVALVAFWWSVNHPRQSLRRANDAFLQRDFANSLKLTKRYLSINPSSNEALVLAGQAAVELGDIDGAMGYFSRVQATGDPEVTERLVAAGELAFHSGRATQAEQVLRAALRSEPDHAMANGLLAYLLVLEGRAWEATPFLIAPIRRADFPAQHLILLGTDQPRVENDSLLQLFLQQVPDDPIPLIGVARQSLAENDLERAETLLRRVVKAAPQQIEAQVRLGEVLLGAPDAWRAWHALVPQAAEDHPQLWVVRGLWAERHENPRVAVRFFWEAVQRDPNHLEANQGLGRTLQLLGNANSAASFLERAARLERLDRTVDSIRRNLPLAARRESLALVAEASQLTEFLGRPWEAWAWSVQALQVDPHTIWAQDTHRRLEPKLGPQLTQNTKNPASLVDVSDFPLPSSITLQEPSDVQPSVTRALCQVAFSNDASSVGLEFTYDNDGDASDDVVRLIETTGGGVGALDFDCDGWPDIYFTQGAKWPEASSTKLPTPRDRLFRSLSGRRFDDATDRAGLGDLHYSQGVAVGDFDNDGFPDLYVANIGPNQLYHNNGDGTFAKVGFAPGAKEHYWTTSCVMADLNGDSLPDIYDVNYASNEDLHAAVCRRGEELGGCSPGAFRAAQDRLFLNLGDGGFRDVTDEAGIVTSDGMGLGVVAADFSGSGRLDLFVANDGFPNSFFVNTSGESDGGVRFESRGVLSGLAFDYQGRAQACMGVAAGDANQDGQLDLFVTNFRNESNTLYLRQPEGLFLDATLAAELRDRSFPMLGFGTQFLDAELDGYPDLVVTNGHVFDMTDRDIPYRMPPQYFQNCGKGRFAEIPAQQLGGYFQELHLGRGLARLDWNRDGREDFVVSHLDTPAALLTNVTSPVGHGFVLQLKGIESNRDAIGAVVTVTTDDRTQVQQLIAGDGYQASNQRQLVFGVGDAEQVDVRVVWPSQRLVQEFQKVPVNTELLLVEGRASLVRLESAR